MISLYRDKNFLGYILLERTRIVLKKWGVESLKSLKDYKVSNTVFTLQNIGWIEFNNSNNYWNYGIVFKTVRKQSSKTIILTVSHAESS